MTVLGDHGVGSTDHFSALKIWMLENKFVSLPSHLKTIEPMEVHRGQELCVIQKLQKVISRTDPMIPLQKNIYEKILWYFIIKCAAAAAFVGTDSPKTDR